MSLIVNQYVLDYIDDWESGKIIFNKERILLVEWLRKNIFTRNDMYFDEEQIENCVGFIEKWYFPLERWQKFLIAFLFLKYKHKNKLVFNKHFWTLGRGGGKNGLASGTGHYFISPKHGVKGYNVGIVATSEDQATTSIEEIHNTVLENKILQKYFKSGMAKTTSKSTRSWFKYYTSNAKTKDGARLGCIFFDELHEYADNKLINVFMSGFGKRPYSRRIFMGTDGYVRDGAYDQQMSRAMSILNGEIDDLSYFPFICRIDEIDEIDNFDMWQKANPMLHPPLSDYAQTLFDEMKSDYQDLKFGGDKIEFIVKRMNFSAVDSQQSVATKDQIRRASKPLPDLTGYKAVGGLDLASKKDFIGAGVLSRDGDEYYWDTHSFVMKGFLDNYQIRAPIDEWAKPVTKEEAIKRRKKPRDALLTIVDDVEIDIQLVVDYFVKMREKYDFDTIVIDNYRSLTVKKPLEDAGFTVIIIYKSRMYQAGVALNVQTLFARDLLSWGNNPLMMWYTNNVVVERDTYDNMVYGKRGRNLYKTDGFMAFTLAYWYGMQHLPAGAEEFMFGDFWD